MSRAVVTLHLFVLTIMLLHELAMVVLALQGAKKQLCLSKGYLHTVAFRSSPCLLLLRQAGCSANFCYRSYCASWSVLRMRMITLLIPRCGIGVKYTYSTPEISNKDVIIIQYQIIIPIFLQCTWG